MLTNARSNKVAVNRDALTSIAQDRYIAGDVDTSRRIMAVVSQMHRAKPSYRRPTKGTVVTQAVLTEMEQLFRAHPAQHVPFFADKTGVHFGTVATLLRQFHTNRITQD